MSFLHEGPIEGNKIRPHPQGADAIRIDIGKAEEMRRNQRTIQIKGGSLSENADEAEHALRVANVDIFRQRGTLVPPSASSAVTAKAKKCKRQPSPEATVAALRDLLCRHARWEKYDERCKEMATEETPPRDVAETVLHRNGEGRRWRTLAGVTKGTPFLRRMRAIASTNTVSMIGPACF